MTSLYSNKLSSSLLFKFAIIFILFIFSQSATAVESCYLASDSTNRLTFVPDRTDGSTAIDVGPFGVPNIEALAKDPSTGVLYAANANRLGTVNLDTGAFTAAANTFGTAFAANGNLTSNVNLSDVDALAFDLSTGFLYGAQRRSGNEILFRINPATGALVPGVFGGNDYLLVSGYGSTDDLAIDQAGVMYASSGANLYTINFAAVGTVAATLVGSYGGPNDIEGLSTDIPGNLIGSTGANDSNSAFNNSIWSINKTTGAASNQTSVPIGGDYEGIACALATVDLSLAKTVALTNDVDSSGTITAGDQITYSILVTNSDANQIVSGVEVTDNISTLAGLTFVSASSNKASPANPYNSTTGVWALGAIPASTSYQLNIVYSVDASAAGNTLINTAEITQSANPDPDSAPDNDDGDQSEDDEDNASFTVDVFADLEISKDDSNTNYTPGGISSYVLTITNNGPSAVSAAAIQDNLPNGVTLSAQWSCSATASSSCSAASGGSIGGSAVSLTSDIINGGVITVTVPVLFSANMGDY